MIYQGKQLKENEYFVVGEFAQLQIDDVVEIEVETGEILYGRVVTRSGGGAVVEV